MLVAAHELKAPLSLMRQLALAIDSADETTCQRYRSQLINVSERALRQVNDLVKIARLEDGFFETEPVSVRGVCEAVLSELSPFFRIEGVVSTLNSTINHVSPSPITTYFTVLFIIFVSTQYIIPSAAASAKW